MIHLHELKPGDRVFADYDGKQFEGVVEETSFEKACVRIAANDHINWYDPAEVDPIPLTEDQLLAFGFVRSKDLGIAEKGRVYIRGPFTLTYPEHGNDQLITLEYQSEEPRLIKHGLKVHELQNHYLGMTKVHLEK
ncbi:MAG TPA: hypothetical protein VNE41_08370, partial [Chitinophagaceae bacterium]|nr:hypothetical protein [Chitinophagaceae bacterium]